MPTAFPHRGLTKAEQAVQSINGAIGRLETLREAIATISKGAARRNLTEDDQRFLDASWSGIIAGVDNFQNNRVEALDRILSDAREYLSAIPKSEEGA